METRTNEDTARRGAASLLGAVRAALSIDFVSFRGKVVLITGGSRGLGLVLARRLVREGARVALLARDEEELSRAREDLRRRGGDALVVKCDVRERAQIQSAARKVSQEMGPVEVLINNAGTITVGPLEAMTTEDFDDAMRTHFYGALWMTLAVLPDMRKAGRGRIINISSVGGEMPAPHALPYTASKFALRGLSEGLRAELLKDGIVVTTVCPGFMRTGSPYNCFFKGQNRREMAWFMLADSLPILSMDADRAARIILRASRLGRAEITLTTVAKIAARVHGVFPGLVTDRLGFLGRLLPDMGGIGPRRAKGSDSLSRISTSILTILTQRAAQDNNELPPDPRDEREERESGREAGEETGREAGEETGKEAGKEAGKETGKEAGKESGREAGKHSGKETHKGGKDSSKPGRHGRPSSP